MWNKSINTNVNHGAAGGDTPPAGGDTLGAAMTEKMRGSFVLRFGLSAINPENITIKINA